MALAGSTRANTVQVREGIGANIGTRDSNVIPLPWSELETMGNTTPNVEEWIRFYRKDEWMVIGAGERRDGGLFHFREVPTTQVFKTTPTTSIPFDLWHKRLGHPSLDVLKLLPQVNLNKKDRELSQSCDVCHRAKQSREKFPSECILTAAYLINRTLSSILNGKTPYTVLHNVEPPYNHLRTFGCLCYAHTKMGDKFASCSRKCVFVGYPYGEKGWRLFDLEKLEFFVSRDVDFSKLIFPYDTEPIVPSVNENEYNDTRLHEEPPSQDREENLERGHRKKETSIRLRDYVTNTVKKKSPSRSTPPAQSRSSGTPYPIAHYVNCDKFSSCHRTFLEAIEKEREPVTYYETIKDKRWRSAMNSKLEALEQNKT
uniref:Uncharacterized protein n=1 Tax=Tanacetum cinerariifolium TaxID=118510 RepID=A0A6L2M095_TANCI|nr:hypothetical protein [Tanacetum cinerariifolium]